ncbi:unnamed protein product [Calypogeia fissa]
MHHMELLLISSVHRRPTACWKRIFQSSNSGLRFNALCMKRYALTTLSSPLNGFFVEGHCRVWRKARAGDQCADLGHSMSAPCNSIVVRAPQAHSSRRREYISPKEVQCGGFITIGVVLKMLVLERKSIFQMHVVA